MLQTVKKTSTVVLFLAFLFIVQSAFAQGLCKDLFFEPAAKLSKPIGPEFFVGKRVNLKNLFFTYKILPRAADKSKSGAIYVWYRKNKKYHKIGKITFGTSLWCATRPSAVDFITLNDDFQGKGLGSMLYTLAAKLNYNAYKETFTASSDQRSSAAVNAWERLYANGLADDNQAFYIDVLNGKYLDPLMKFFNSQSEEIK